MQPHDRSEIDAALGLNRPAERLLYASPDVDAEQSADKPYRPRAWEYLRDLAILAAVAGAGYWLYRYLIGH